MNKLGKVATTVSIRITMDDVDKIRALIEDGDTVSGYIRSVVLFDLDKGCNDSVFEITVLKKEIERLRDKIVNLREHLVLVKGRVIDVIRRCRL